MIVSAYPGVSGALSGSPVPKLPGGSAEKSTAKMPLGKGPLPWAGLCTGAAAGVPPSRFPDLFGVGVAQLLCLPTWCSTAISCMETAEIQEGAALYSFTSR